MLPTTASCFLLESESETKIDILIQRNIILIETSIYYLLIFLHFGSFVFNVTYFEE